MKNESIFVKPSTQLDKTYVVRIPVKPYLAKFLVVQAGDTSICSWKKEQFPIWQILRPYFEYKSYDGLTKDQRKRIHETYSAEIQISIPIETHKKYGESYSESSVTFINRVLVSKFKEELYHFVENKIAKQDCRYKGVNEAIDLFCLDHFIEIGEDITEDAVRKLYSREKKRREKIKSSRQELSKKIGFANVLPAIRAMIL